MNFFIPLFLVVSLLAAKTDDNSANQIRQINGVTVPSDFPQIHSRQFGETAPGKLFFGSIFTDETVGNYLIICENDGTPYFYQKFDKKRNGRGSGEFQVQPTGVLTAYLFDPELFIVIDSTFTIIDTLQCGNGYGTDPHELTLLPDGHALLIAKEVRQIDMSAIVKDGNPQATVLGNHVQELDEQKNVVFEWKCWDHLDIQDAIHENLRGEWIDYVHMNSVYPDYDGHLIVSSRHLSEITKINRNTGEIIWRLGGVNNQFEFINDSIEISYQHHARPVPGKPNFYTFLDNGNFRNPQFSRAVEYKLDLEHKTAEKTWEFRFTPDRYSFMLGSVQRFVNQNTLINWSTWPPLFANEVASDGTIVYEIEAEGVSSNRVRRYEWNGVAARPYLLAEPRTDGVLLIFNKFGDALVQHYIVYGGTSPQNLIPMDTTANTYSYLTALENNLTYHFQVCAVDSHGTKSPFSNKIEHAVNIRKPGDNILTNGNFEEDTNGWSFLARNPAQARAVVKAGVLNITIQNGGVELVDLQLYQEHIPLIQGQRYRFEFDGWAENNRMVEAQICRREGETINYSQTAPIVFKRSPQHFAFEFSMTEPTDIRAQLLFNFGMSNVDCHLDNVSLVLLTETQIEAPQQPLLFKLQQNYPNPFNAATTIAYRLAQSSEVELTIYNVVGAEIAAWSWQGQSAGMHYQRINTSTWSSGLYFYELTATDSGNRLVFVERKKMILIK